MGKMRSTLQGTSNKVAQPEVTPDDFG